jgi:hypothetical protein
MKVPRLRLPVCGRARAAGGMMLPVTPPPPLTAEDSAGAMPTASLWRELADGSARWGVRLVVTVAIGVALAGLVPILAYFLAATNPAWNRGSGGVSPEDGLIAFLVAMAAGGYLAACAWLWTRTGRRRAVVGPVVLTIAIAAATFTLGVLVDDNLGGDQEMVVLGLGLLAFAGVLLVWLNAFRRRGPRWRALRDRQDGLPDVRCPTCNYRMVGLTESRCPECGTGYTLDELIARQGFGPAAPGPASQHVPPPPPALRSA